MSRWESNAIAEYMKIVTIGIYTNLYGRPLTGKELEYIDISHEISPHYTLADAMWLKDLIGKNDGN